MITKYSLVEVASEIKRRDFDSSRNNKNQPIIGARACGCALERAERSALFLLCIVHIRYI